ncbi:pelota family protein [Candidatus Woesearchaeota archaeon]|nr:pelota family protein [Candidatus Woesearchaeota archaeon]
MIPLKLDFNHNIVSLKVSLPDDLWYLSHIIAVNDSMTMKTERKIKLGGSDTNAKVVKKIIVLTITVEDISFSDDSSQLRVKGKVTQGPEDVPHGSYHTFGISVNDTFTLVKPSWPNFTMSRLDEAIKNRDDVILFVLYDREQVLFSSLRQTGIQHLGEQKGDVQKKQFDSSSSTVFYDDILKQTQLYDEQLKPKSVVFATANFFKSYVEKKLPDSLKKKSFFIESTVVSKSVVSKLLSRPELQNILASQRLQSEVLFVDEVLKELNKDMVAYGFDDVVESATTGAISYLGLTETFLKKSREENFYDALDMLLQQVDSSNAKIIFIYGDDAKKTIDGLGGIVGVLRWKAN